MGEKLRPEEVEIMDGIITKTAEQLVGLLNATTNGAEIVDQINLLTLSCNSQIPPYLALRVRIVIGVLEDENRLMIGYRYIEDSERLLH